MADVKTEKQPLNWILLRGFGRESRHWLDFPKNMARDLGQEVHCLDLPGFGTEADRFAPLSITATVEDLRARFIKLSHGEKDWACLGHSFGGMVAIRWSELYPRDFRKLVLINVSSKEVAATLHRLSVFAVYCLLRAELAKNERQRERQILKMISNLKSDDEDVLQKYAEIARTSPVRLEKLLKQAGAASQFMASGRLDVPALFLASMKDKMVDVRCSKALAERYGATIKFHGTAGHDLPLDDPDWVIARIKEFVDANAS